MKGNESKARVEAEELQSRSGLHRHKFGTEKGGWIGNILKPNLCRTGGRPQELDVESEDTER